MKVRVRRYKHKKHSEVPFKMNLNFINTKDKCNWCEKVFKEGYYITASNDDEIKLIEKRFKQFKLTPVLFICEDCLFGRCKQSKLFFKEEFEK